MLDNVWNAARRLVGRRADDVPAAGAAEREPVAAHRT